MEDLISIVIPAYNVEAYIEKCLVSVINQTYHNIEVIIVNDGSKDGTQTICEKYEALDKRVRVINQINSGGSFSRNKGMNEACGKYLCFVDADDIINEMFVERLYQNYITNNADLAICGFEEKKGEEIINATSGKLQILTQEEAMEQLLTEGSFKGYVWNKLFHMDIIRKYHLQFDISIKIWEDVLFVYQYMLYCKKVVFDPKPMYTYMYIQNSISHSDNHLVGIEKAYSAIRAKDYIADMVPEGYESVRKQLSIRYVQSSLAVIRNIGYSKEKNVIEYYNQSICTIKKHKKVAYKYLSKKDKILVNLCVICPKMLILLYRLASHL